VSGTISPLSTSARIYNGALSVLLVPTTTAAPGSYYQVVYSSSDGTAQWTETWQVPPSSNALSVAGVRTSSTPGSSSGSGTVSGSGSGTTQFATLPIAMTQVTGLTASLNTLNSSLNSLTSTVNGLASGSSGIAFVDAETPGGTANGVNTAFTLAGTPSPAASLELYRNGVLQTTGIDYTLSGSVITFLAISVPKTGDVLQAFYRKAGSAPAPTFVDGEIPGGAINGINLAFTLTAAPNPAVSLRLYKNGVLLQQSADYAVSGSSIAFTGTATPQSGDSLTAFYRH
jgi:hypothetical protein